MIIFYFEKRKPAELFMLTCLQIELNIPAEIYDWR